MLHPVASRRILACRDTLAAGLATRHTGLHPAPRRDAADPSGLDINVAQIGMPRGVSVKVLSSTPAMVRPLDPDDLPSLHALALGEAWRDGAWDLEVTYLPPLDGAALGMVTASMDWSACPSHLPQWLICAAKRGLLVTWLWLPMRDGPEGRRKQHAARDTSLDPEGARAGLPPQRADPDWSWRDGRSWTIRLGTPAPVERHRTAPARPSQRRGAIPLATDKQRRYIVALLRAAGERPDLPARLNIREASAMIDKLRGEIDG